MSTSSTFRDAICSAAYVPRPPYHQLQDSDSKSNFRNSAYSEGNQNYAGHQRSWGHHQRLSGHQRQESSRLANSISLSSEGYSPPSVLSSVPLASKRWLVSSGMTRRLREFIPEFKKDREYWQKRFRNNEAAKRSREKRRINDVVMGRRIYELSSENKRLRLELETIKRHFNLALNVRFDHERDDLSPKCAAVTFIESQTVCPDITTINDDIDDDESSLLGRNCPVQEYDLSRCVESDLEFNRIDSFESSPNMAIDQSNESKLGRGYRRLTPVTNIQDELEKFERVCATRNNPLLTQGYGGQARETNNYPKQFKQNLKQVEQQPAFDIERLHETRLHDIPLSPLNSVKRIDYSSGVITSAVSTVTPILSTSSLNTDDSGRGSSQAYYNKNDAGYGVEKKARFSLDEKTGTSYGGSDDNVKNSRLPFNTINNLRHQDVKLSYDQRGSSILEASQVSPDFALELVNISSDEEEVKYALPTSACSSGSANPATPREVPLNLSKRYPASSVNMLTYNDLDFDYSRRSYFNRKDGIFNAPLRSRIVNSAMPPSVPLHSVAPLSTNKPTTSLPPIICMTSPIAESHSNDPRDLLPMPPLSRIAAVGPLPTISTLAASHARQHLPELSPPTLRDSENAVSDCNGRIANSNFEDTSGNRFEDSEAFDELRGCEVMNKHVRGGVPLKVWHKLSASVVDREKYSEVTPLTKSIPPSVISDKCIDGSRVCRQNFVQKESMASSSSVDDIRYGQSIAWNSNKKDVEGGRGQLRDGFGRGRATSRDLFEARHLVTTAPLLLNDNRSMDPIRARVPNDFALAMRSISQ